MQDIFVGRKKQYLIVSAMFETFRQSSFCVFFILQNDLLIVESNSIQTFRLKVTNYKSYYSPYLVSVIK